MVEAFSQEVVSRLTGLTARQLSYWDEIALVRPSVAPHEPWLPRLYSLQDVMKLKVAAEMRKRDLLPHRIRELVHQLEERGFENPLLTLRFVGDPEKGRVFWVDPAAGLVPARHLDQHASVFDLRMRDLRRGLEADIAELSNREPGKIVQLRRVQGNRPVLHGTRVPTEKIALLQSQGWDVDRILFAYPHLTRPDVEAAIEHEARRRRAESA